MKRLIAPVLLAIAVTLAAAPTGCAKRAVAKVNGDMITEQEFYGRLEDAAGRQVLDRLILEHLIAQKAKAKSIVVTDAEINQALEAGKKRIGSDRWQEFLKMSAQSEDSIKRDLRQSLLLTKLLITDKELKEYYEQNRTKFDEPPTATYRRIVLKNKADADKVRQEIASGKLSFTQAVKEKSTDSPVLKERGAEIGPVSEGMGDPNVGKLLFTLKIGETSEPIPVTFPQGGYQLIEVLKRTEGKKHSFDEVKDRVSQSLMASKQAEVEKFIGDLRADAIVAVFQPKYQSVAEQYAKLRERKPPQIPSAPSPGAPKGPQQPQGQPTPPAQQPPAPSPSK
jgi:parvulin-like peptidyl-prolyl isomerase